MQHLHFLRKKVAPPAILQSHFVLLRPRCNLWGFLVKSFKKKVIHKGKNFPSYIKTSSSIVEIINFIAFIEVLCCHQCRWGFGQGFGHCKLVLVNWVSELQDFIGNSAARGMTFQCIKFVQILASWHLPTFPKIGCIQPCRTMPLTNSLSSVRLLPAWARSLPTHWVPVVSALPDPGVKVAPKGFVGSSNMVP